MVLNLILVRDLPALVQTRLTTLHNTFDSLTLFLVCLHINALLVATDLIIRGQGEVTQFGHLPHALVFHTRHRAAAVLDLY